MGEFLTLLVYFVIAGTIVVAVILAVLILAKGVFNLGRKTARHNPWRRRSLLDVDPEAGSSRRAASWSSDHGYSP